MIRNSHYFSVNRALWNHIKFNDVHELRKEEANENSRNAIMERTESVMVKTAEKEIALLDA